MALFFAVTFPNGVLFKTGVDLQGEVSGIEGKSFNSKGNV